MKRIGVYLFPGVEELDAIGPWEVLAFWTQEFPDDGWEVVLLGDSVAPVKAAKGALLTPQKTLSSLTEQALDILVYPGGQGTRSKTQDPAHLSWLREVHRQGTLIASVCTGALVLAAAGLLEGRQATTYWQSYAELQALEPSVDIQKEARWIDTGDIITAAGVSAGIDMALHLVTRLVGSERAHMVKRGIQYEPAPPV